MSTTSVPARYSPSNTAVTIEMPASRSELKSNRTSRIASPSTKGMPPTIRATNSGIAGHEIPNTVSSIEKANRSSKYSAMATIAMAAIASSCVSHCVMDGVGCFMAPWEDWLQKLQLPRNRRCLSGVFVTIGKC